MMRYITLLATVLAVFLAAPAMGEITLNYVGMDDLGNGKYRHNYEAQRSVGDLRDARDFHIEGQFEWTQGTVELTAPGNWDCMVYTGPGPYLFNWQINEGEVWDANTMTVSGFGIIVSSPYVTQTPFHCSNDLTDLSEKVFDNFPAGFNIIETGTTYVPIGVPEPALLTMLGMGGLFLFGFFGWKRWR